MKAQAWLRLKNFGLVPDLVSSLTVEKRFVEIFFLITILSKCQITYLKYIFVVLEFHLMKFLSNIELCFFQYPALALKMVISFDMTIILFDPDIGSLINLNEIN